jgi:DNA-binding NtrC family response regulator
VVNIHLPPLRERREDIPLLAAHFVALQNRKFCTAIHGLTHEAMEAAVRYDWPGNIRQMRNVIEASMAMETEEWISLPVLSQFIDVVPEEDVSGVQGGPGSGEEGDYTAALSRFEMDYLKGLLTRHNWNIDAAAREAGMNMATVYRKIKKYGLKHAR